VMGHNPSRFKKCGDTCPMEHVSWTDVQEFLRKLNQMEGTNKYRLPTEAQWEYSCRAGSTTSCYGNDDSYLSKYAWYWSNSEGKTHPVGRKRPNAWGLYDMHGNVWEWCQDWYNENYYARSPQRDPKGPSSGSFRVLRGGSWYEDADLLNSAIRLWNDADSRSNMHGFRVARDP
jgi:formylglycine-generating enzyme required for sulfatase activity